MALNLTNPIFHSEHAAREHFEKIRWPDGPICPHCGGVELRDEARRQEHPTGSLQVQAMSEAVHGYDRHAIRAEPYPAA